MGKSKTHWYPLALIGAGGFLLGLFVAGIIGTTINRADRNANYKAWRATRDATRDAWLSERDEWRIGKPFVYHHGPHHERW